jgi:hypothetical protein
MHDICTLKQVLNLYFKATFMELNFKVSSLISHCFPDNINQQIGDLLPFLRKDIETDFKYVMFILKPNNYRFIYWMWLYKNVEDQVMHSINRLLSRGGRLVLINSVSNTIPMYSS